MKVADMMKITLDIKWNEHIGNDPELLVEVGSLPVIRYEALPYTASDDSVMVLYIAKKGPLYTWLLDSSSEAGFYGREFKMPMIDGSVRTIKGPGASRAGIVNQVLAQNGRTERVTDISNPAGFRGIDPKWAVNHMPAGTYLKKIVKESIEVIIPGGRTYMSEPETTWIPAKH